MNHSTTTTSSSTTSTTLRSVLRKTRPPNLANSNSTTSSTTSSTSSSQKRTVTFNESLNLFYIDDNHTNTTNNHTPRPQNAFISDNSRDNDDGDDNVDPYQEEEQDGEPHHSLLFQNHTQSHHSCSCMYDNVSQPELLELLNYHSANTPYYYTTNSNSHTLSPPEGYKDNSSNNLNYNNGAAAPAAPRFTFPPTAIPNDRGSNNISQFYQQQPNHYYSNIIQQQQQQNFQIQNNISHGTTTTPTTLNSPPSPPHPTRRKINLNSQESSGAAGAAEINQEINQEISFNRDEIKQQPGKGQGHAKGIRPSLNSFLKKSQKLNPWGHSNTNNSDPHHHTNPPEKPTPSSKKKQQQQQPTSTTSTSTSPILDLIPQIAPPGASSSSSSSQLHCSPSSEDPAAATYYYPLQPDILKSINTNYYNEPFDVVVNNAGTQTNMQTSNQPPLPPPRTPTTVLSNSYTTNIPGQPPPQTQPAYTPPPSAILKVSTGTTPLRTSEQIRLAVLSSTSDTLSRKNRPKLNTSDPHGTSTLVEKLRWLTSMDDNETTTTTMNYDEPNVTNTNFATWPINNNNSKQQEIKIINNQQQQQQSNWGEYNEVIDQQQQLNLQGGQLQQDDYGFSHRPLIRANVIPQTTTTNLTTTLPRNSTPSANTLNNPQQQQQLAPTLSSLQQQQQHQQQQNEEPPSSRSTPFHILRQSFESKSQELINGLSMNTNNIYGTVSRGASGGSSRVVPNVRHVAQGQQQQLFPIELHPKKVGQHQQLVLLTHHNQQQQQQQHVCGYHHHHQPIQMQQQQYYTLSPHQQQQQQILTHGQQQQQQQLHPHVDLMKTSNSIVAANNHQLVNGLINQNLKLVKNRDNSSSGGSILVAGEPRGEAEGCEMQQQQSQQQQQKIGGGLADSSLIEN